MRREIQGFVTVRKVNGESSIHLAWQLPNGGHL